MRAMQMAHRRSRHSRKKKHSIVLRVALVAFAVYLVYLIFSIMKVSASNAALENELSRTEAAIAQQQMTNYELNDKTENPELFLEEIARENGYVKPGEEIFKEIPGN